ncbi:hypothetical protein N7528_009693 [Penicillium herquei]|nr:hypothetical protein N7528_009693 [Penicillium herquei]
MSLRGQSSTYSGSLGPSSHTLRGGRKARPNDAFIALMGVTGSGKSSFIELCSGKPAGIGHGMNGYTEVVDVFAYEISSDQTVYLIDTPGFDDTSKSDSLVLREIATWLARSFKEKILLSGIIYLHRATDRRMQGSARKNIVMFQQLCGEGFLKKKKVILVTTMWDTVLAMNASERRKYESLEKELKQTPEFWGGILQFGISYHRHLNTAQSARQIVQQLVNRDPPLATSLQEELVTQNKPLNETFAGREVINTSVKVKEELIGKLREIQGEIERTHEASMREFLRGESDNLMAEIDRIEEDTKSMHTTIQKLESDYRERITQLEKEIEDLIRHHEVLQSQSGGSAWTQPLPSMSGRQSIALDPSSDDLQMGKILGVPLMVVFPRGMVDKMGLTVLMMGPVLFCLSPLCSIGLGDKPPLKIDSDIYLGYVTAGLGMGCPTGMVGYSNGHTRRLAYDGDFRRGYPGLAQRIDRFGFDTLEKCVLGPGYDQYYAEWFDEDSDFVNQPWSSGFSESHPDVEAALHRARSFREHGAEICALAVGYEGAWVIGIGNPRDLNPEAVTLDPLNKEDFILLYIPRENLREGILCFFHSENEVKFKAIGEWWRMIIELEKKYA